MLKHHSILRGLGVLFVFILMVFSSVFFYAYITGGESKTLSLFAGDGVAVLQIEGAIDDSQTVLAEMKRFKEMPWVKAIVIRIDSPGGAVAPTQEIFEEILRSKSKSPLSRRWAVWRHRGGITSPRPAIESLLILAR